MIEELRLELLVNKYGCPCHIVSSHFVSKTSKTIDGRDRLDPFSRLLLPPLRQIAYSALPGYVEIANKMMKSGQEWLFGVLDLNYEFIEYRILKDTATQAAARELSQMARLLEQIYERRAQKKKKKKDAFILMHDLPILDACAQVTERVREV